MCKKLIAFLLSSFLLAWILFNNSLAFAGEEIEYRFERVWPHLEQPWYFSGPSGIAEGPDNSVYIADTYNHQIKVFTEDGTFVRSWGREGAGNGEFNQPGPIAIGLNGQVYIADMANHRIQVFTLRGDFLFSWGRSGESEGEFNSLTGIAISQNGKIYVSDTLHRVQVFTPEGQFIKSWGSEGSGQGEFLYPTGISINTSGHVYVTDLSNFRVQVFSAEGEFIRSWEILRSDSGYSDQILGVSIDQNDQVFVVFAFSIDVYTAQGELIRSWGDEEKAIPYFNSISINSNGRVYVTDGNSNNIRVFTAKGELINSWGVIGQAEGKFSYPHDVSISNQGRVYVTDSGNQRVQVFTDSGRFLFSWSIEDPEGISISSIDEVYVTNTDYARIEVFTSQGEYLRGWAVPGSNQENSGYPLDIDISPNGQIYVTAVSSLQNNLIHVFTPDGQLIRTWGSQGVPSSGYVYAGQKISISPDELVYISDTHNHRIQVFTPEGQMLRSWGGEGIDEGQFRFPEGISVGSNGQVYVADSYNKRIQVFTEEGVFIESISNTGTILGKFVQPHGVTVNASDELYVVDVINHDIQKFIPKTKIASTHPYKAIVLAGGGEKIGGRTNHIWNGTWRVTQKAYKALSRQAFVIHEEIKFLTAGSTQFDLDNNNKFDDLEKASKESLRRAITEWAADAKDVVIFLANHGGPGKFQINGTEILTGKELNSWVSLLEDSIPGKVTVIIEACNSASFFNQISRPKRNLLASAKADQPAVISNDGLSSFSYFLWSEIGTGALLKNAFEDARKAMSPIIIDGRAQNAQADTNGDRQFTRQDLEGLGDYCLGNCNQTAAAAPVIAPIKPSSRTLNGEMAQDFSIKVDHLQALNRVWALVQRPDDISIDPNQALNFESIKLTCNKQDICQGRYEKFDLIGEYRVSFYAMDDQYEVSFPEVMTINQTQGKTVIPAVYDEQLAVVYLRDVLVDGQHIQAALELQGDKFVVIAFSEALKEYTPIAQFETKSGLLKVPHALAFGSDYQATFKYLGNLEFELQSASPK